MAFYPFALKLARVLVEIELSVLVNQCPRRRIGTIDLLRTEEGEAHSSFSLFQANCAVKMRAVWSSLAEAINDPSGDQRSALWPW